MPYIAHMTHIARNLISHNISFDEKVPYPNTSPPHKKDRPDTHNTDQNVVTQEIQIETTAHTGADQNVVTARKRKM